MAHVLIVDDDADIRLAMRTLLEEIGGHTVIEAENGIVALERLRTMEEPSVVLLDLLMPGLDGVEVVQAVATDEVLASRHTYVLVSVSRRAMSEDISQRLGLAVPVVPKPFDMDQLLQTVEGADRRLRE